MFTGRMNRKEFLLPALYCITLPYIFIVPLAENILFVTFVFLLLLLFFTPMIIRRLHGMGLSGWFSVIVLTFTPTILYLPLVILDTLLTLISDTLALFVITIHILTLIPLFVLPGRKEKNKHGEMSLRKKSKLKTLLYLFAWIFWISATLLLVSGLKNLIVIQ